MNKLRQLFSGSVHVALTCAEPGEALSSYVDRGFAIKEPRLEDALVLSFWLPASQWEELQQRAEKRGELCKCLESRGGLAAIKRIRGRLPLCLMLTVMIFLALNASQRIWFFRVEGNEKLPEKEILAAAQECGLTFWTKVDEVNSQLFKNRLLNALPQLQWAGVNFSGGIVTVNVRERLEGESIRQNTEVMDVVASRDGIVVSMSVLGGQALCQVGQAVTEGEILVTGCVEHEYQTQYTTADAEIYALTQRQICAVFPAGTEKLPGQGGKSLCISLVFGRNKIKIFGNSGIPGMTCDKIKRVIPLTLPGGYQLPFSLVLEQMESYETVCPAVQSWEEAKSLSLLDDYVSGNMVAGEILNRKVSVSDNKDFMELDAVYSCREMIARQKKILWFEGEATNDGKNRKHPAGGGAD